MNVWRSLFFTSLGFVIAGFCFLAWEQRHDRTTPIAQAAQSNRITMANNFAGGEPPVDQPNTWTHEELSGFDVAEGKRLYKWFNCNTCHAAGGGDIGPAFTDDKWLYGSNPENIFASIVEGRPNGMPSFRGKIPDAQVWQIAAYIRAMSGHVPLYARPGRDDAAEATKPESMIPTQPTHPTGPASPDSRSSNK